MDLATVRHAIVDGLAPVAAAELAGRVYPYPPELGRQSGPAVWVEQPELSVSSTGAATQIVVAEFDVWIVVDGALAAQVAALDAAVAQVWAAMRAASIPSAPLRPVAVRRDAVDTQRAESRRAAVVTVEATIAAVSFCPPTPEPVQIPPTLVSASVEE